MLIMLAQKLVVIYALILTMLAADKFGLTGLILKPLERVKNQTWMLVLWYIIPAIISGFFPNIICISVFAPIAFAYSKLRNINTSAIMLSLGFGITIGNDITPMGGAGNLAAWGLIQKGFGYDPGVLGWIQVMGVPTLTGIIITLFWIWLLVFKKLPDTMTDEKSPGFKFDFLFIVKTLLVILTLYFGLAKVPFYYAAISAVLLAILQRLTIADFKQLPWKVAVIFGVAFLIGAGLDLYMKSNPGIVSMLQGNYSFTKVLSVTMLFTVLTNFLNDGALTLSVIPAILRISGHNLWLFALVMKAIDINYLTVVSDTGLALSCAYGLRQRDLFKIGLPIVITLVIARVLWFYFTQGMSFYIL